MQSNGGRRRPANSDALLAAIVESADDAIIGKSLDGTIREWNPAAQRMFGYAADEIVGENISLIVPPDLRDEEREILARIARGERIRNFESRRLRRDGSELDVSLTVSPIVDAAGAVIGASKIARDISERKHAERRIERLNRTYAVLSGINSLIVRVSDRNVLFREACRIATGMGHFRAAWIGICTHGHAELEVVAAEGEVRHILLDAVPLATGEDNDPGYGLVGEALGTLRAAVSNDAQNDPRVPRRDECLKRGICSIAIFPLVVDGGAVGVLGLQSAEKDFFDAEELRLFAELAGDVAFAHAHIIQQESLENLTYYDALTGLANHKLFRERLRQHIRTAAREGGRLAVLAFDIEHFKTFNDTLGRHAGDELLRQVAARCVVHAFDRDLLARILGDRFAVIVPEMRSEDHVARLAEERYREIFGPPFRLGESDLRLSARYGLALYPDDGPDADALYQNAESALKSAKATSARYLFYTKEMSQRVAERLDLEGRLLRALERKEFVLHYQPKLDFETHRCVGVEALLRWQSGDSGLVAPGSFIPLLEETDLILEVGAWVAGQAVADYARLAAAGMPEVRIAVNVSPIQLRKSDFVATMQDILSRGTAAPGIDVEVTESVLMHDVHANIEKLASLREMGLGIAIDDFGTGYSSLAYLAKLPVQTIKIDRSFVITMLNEPDTMTLVSTIISLAHSLRMSVVAEGVDAEEQAKILRLLKCDEMQGYLYCKPIPFDALLNFLRDPKSA
ncbi:MAG: EAL domain-containing protein [Burkholderiales bacterium]